MCLWSKVLFWENGSHQSEAQRVRIISTSALLSGLKSSTVYLISVRGQNSAGLGPCSPAFNITTKKPRESIHTGPKQLNILCFTHTLLLKSFHAWNRIVVFCSSCLFYFFQASFLTSIYPLLKWTYLFCFFAYKSYLWLITHWSYASWKPLKVGCRFSVPSTVPSCPMNVQFDWDWRTDQSLDSHQGSDWIHNNVEYQSNNNLKTRAQRWIVADQYILCQIIQQYTICLL